MTRIVPFRIRVEGNEVWLRLLTLSCNWPAEILGPSGSLPCNDPCPRGFGETSRNATENPGEPSHLRHSAVLIPAVGHARCW